MWCVFVSENTHASPAMARQWSEMETVRIPDPHSGLRCGSSLLTQENADGYLLICGGKPWEWENSEEAAELCASVRGLNVIYNLFCGSLSFRTEAAMRRRIADAVFRGSVYRRPEIRTVCTGFSGTGGLDRGGDTSRNVVFERKRNSGRPVRTQVCVIGLGCGRGVGTSHLAISLANYLTGSETKKTALLEWNDHGGF